MKNLCLSAVATLAVLLVLPAMAAANDVYASPVGSGDECSKAAPCSLEKVGQVVSSGGKIFIGPGQYGSPASPLPYRLYTTAPDARFFGDPEATLYIDSTSTDSSVSLTDNQQIHGNGMRIHSFDPDGLTLYGNTVADRVWVRTTMDDSTACAIRQAGTATGGTFFNTVCVADTNSGGKGLFFHATANDGIGNARGVTGVATGTGSVGIGMENTGAGGGGMSSSSDMFVYGSLANATGAGSLDFSSVNDSALNKACLAVFSSASINGFAGQCPGLGTQTVNIAPSFVSPGTDYHQKPGSPVINGLGGPAFGGATEFDLDGYPRDQANPDPGAYERQSPTASTLPASALTLTRATLNATGQTSYGTGTARFEYGPTAAYGSSTPLKPVGRSTPPQKLSQAITGLSSGTTFHARVVVTSPDGDVTRGKDVTFRTASKVVCRVPKLKGLKLPGAKRKLKRANCRLGKVKRRGGKFVRKQSPKAGKVLKAGSKVKVTVGRKVKR